MITEMPPVPGKMPRESMRGARFNSLLPLLRNESYIGDIEWQDSPTDITHDLTQFRIQGWNGKENLAEWQARALSMSSLDMSPWLTIPRSPSGRIVVSRSLRYQNPTFPWKEVDERYGSRLLFIGLKEEMSAFRRLLGHHVDWVPTDNFLEVAEHIKASTLFIGNQSAPFWIAAGLGHNLIQEVWDREPNSIVQRKNASYIYEGFPLPPL